MRILIIATTAIVLVSGPAWAASDDYNLSRSNNTTAAPAETTDPVLRKRPGRTKYGDVTLKRGHVEAPEQAQQSMQPTQIDPPSLQLEAGPANNDMPAPRAKKPKEIVVVGSKAEKKPKNVTLPEVDDEVLVNKKGPTK